MVLKDSALTMKCYKFHINTLQFSGHRLSGVDGFYACPSPYLEFSSRGGVANSTLGP